MKKNLILMVALLFACVLANAQTEKDTQTIGLNLGFSGGSSNGYSTNTSNNSSTSISSKGLAFNIGPQYSYFIADKLDIGASISYSTNNTNNSNFNTDIYNGPLKQFNNSYGASVFIRKYFLYANKIGFRTGPYLSYSKGNSGITYIPFLDANNYGYHQNDFQAGVNLALVCFPAKHISITAAIANLGFDHNHQDNGTQNSTNGNYVFFNFVNNLQLSVCYVLGNK